MSVWVHFEYAPASPGQTVEAKSASAQVIGFVRHDKADQELWGVYTPFAAEYLVHLDEEEARFEEAIAGLSEEDRMFEYADWGYCGSAKPFDPKLLLSWATRWRELLETASADELDYMLWGCADEWSLQTWKQDMDEFQQFARQAMADGVLLTMSVV